MLNHVIIKITNFLGFLLGCFALQKKYRNREDVRLVHYHGIGPGMSKCMRFLSDEINASTFESHIEYLRQNYCLHSLDEVTELVTKNGFSDLDKPSCSITFDDGLSSVYEFAFPILKENNIPFTVFINTSVIENENLLWLHLLNFLFSSFSVNETVRSINAHTSDKALHMDPNNSAADVVSFIRSNIEYFHNNNTLVNVLHDKEISIRDIAQQENMYLSWAQINEMSKHGASFFSHTHSHLPLNALSSFDTVKSEIDIAKSTLLDIGSQCDKYVSFPFGMLVDYGARAREYALQSGHKFVVEVGNGLNPRDRVINNHIYSRVGLGTVSHRQSDIYSALELRPIIKHRIKRMIGARS